METVTRFLIQDEESPRCVVANALHCDILESEFELRSCYYIHFRIKYSDERYELHYSQAMGWIVTLLFFYKDSFGIK